MDPCTALVVRIAPRHGRSGRAARNVDAEPGSNVGTAGAAGAVTNYTAASINRPFAIVTGSDGALWFTNGLYSIGVSPRPAR